ncbi:H/ACA ribonucleoprotein complex non-core subunit NAF1 [Cladobotryum mycophilum]|uniref:H/ACA ribonucleoprotein complex non-core subunit NAF1 n=1 Tax=Cladobotryum mycophilum TaxID=491253 RepID=A0ABR0S7Z9_9HYPO
MSGFQIPGLGQAKPNETLPPLPQDLAVAAASVAEDNEMKDANPPPIDTTPAANTNGERAKAAVPEQSEENETSDSMAIDQPESPPSLTHALEAAIGGLGDVSAEPQAAPEPQEQVPLQPDQSENPEWELDSSPYESSSESSSSDSSSDEDSDNEGYELLGVEETARLLMETEGGSDDEGERGGKASGSGYMRTKNELPEEVIPKPEVIITPEMKVEELGAIEHIVENIMLIKAFTPGEYQVLDTGSVLCNADRVVIGVIAETIGKVLQPMYTVLFNSEDEIKEFGLEVGTKVFYPVEHASFVFTEPLKSLKGSDASNLHDEEIGDEEMEFSDDEKEAEYKRSQKQKKKDKWKNGKDAKEPHPLRQETSVSASADGGLNYDEDDDGPYKPLARPAGYGTGPISTESYEPPPRSGFQRGRGRDFKGRGGRGRGSGRGGRGGYGGSRDGYSLPPQGNSQYPQQPSAPPAPPASSWNQPPSTGGAVPSLPNFGFPLAGWPQAPAPAQGQTASVVPPPPGWPVQAQGQQPAASGAFVNPAFFAALMNQMQAQGGQGAWGQQPPSPPPSGGH